MITQNAYVTDVRTGDDEEEEFEFGHGTCENCGSRIRSQCERGYDHCVVCSGGVA